MFKDTGMQGGRIEEIRFWAWLMWTRGLGRKAGIFTGVWGLGWGVGGVGPTSKFIEYEVKPATKALVDV